MPTSLERITGGGRTRLHPGALLRHRHLLPTPRRSPVGRLETLPLDASENRQTGRSFPVHTASMSPRKRADRVFFGWKVVVVAFTTALFSWGLGFYGTGIYLVELRAQHGWSIA